jgi:hypothetical protein
MIINILIIVLIVFLLFLLVKSSLNMSYVVKVFKRNNVIVFGKKGTGKDMLFQSVINKRKETHYSNILYTKHKTLLLKISEISLYPNSYENLINDNVQKIDPNLKEKFDIYLSDGGTYLPSQYDYMLHKKYTSLPLFYALQRHLYNSNFHVNVQSLSRLWKPLRELADGYFKMERTIFIGPIFIMTFTFYDRYESAEQSLLPMPSKLLNAVNNGLAAQYKATNGIIKPMFIIGLKRKVYYDTRHFKKVFLNDNPTKKFDEVK